MNFCPVSVLNFAKRCREIPGHASEARESTITTPEHSIRTLAAGHSVLASGQCHSNSPLRLCDSVPGWTARHSFRRSYEVTHSTLTRIGTARGSLSRQSSQSHGHS